MKSRLGLISGIGLATLGVGGLAAGGIAWNFQGRSIGLGATVASLVVIAISLVILRPQPSEPVVEPEGFDAASTGGGITLQRPQISVLGALLATSGTLGLAASGIAWNFKGIEIGLTGTLTSLLALAFSVLFLWPSANKKVAQPVEAKADVVAESAEVAEQLEAEQISQPTTAEAILKELAEQQENAPPVALSTFAPDNLMPGQGLSSRNRKAGPSLGRYRRMAEDLFRN